MNIHQLETFLSIVKSRNFTKSAELLHVSQSTITSRIVALEEAMGSRLFARNNKQVTLTEMGVSFLPYAERMYSIYKESKEVLELQQKYKAKFVMGGPSSAWNYIFAAPLRKFQHQHGDVACELLTHSSEQTIEKVIDGIIHLGISYIKPRHPSLKVQPLIEDDYVFVAKQKLDRKITLKDLHSPTFVLNNWGATFMEWFYREVGEQFLPSFKINQTMILLKRCLEEDWFTLIPKSIVQSYLDQQLLHVLEHDIAWEAPKHHVYAVTLGRTKAADIEACIAQFLAFLPERMTLRSPT
ncbi:LysR family transcriptional regulator [Paenibacillaceae bacterium]|nr:LysR family transcriptional regulator [Paenibacillaceae bacterium]